jgi:ABC-2 type transport system ATP-binding protein
MDTDIHPLIVSNLHVHYGNREVLKGLSLTLERGAVYGLLGPNGAGKTTLIRTICGRVTAQSGYILVGGRCGRASLPQIGLVPQELAIYPHLSARENLEVFGRLSGLSARDTRSSLKWAAEATGIAPRLDDRVDILSGGWKRRVNIAAAILHRPALLILDEPTVGVDVEARNGIHEVISTLSSGGIGILLATHDLEQAEAICGCVGFLRDGVLTPQGSPRQLLEKNFPDQKEIIIELRAPPPPDHVVILQKSGFSPASGGLVWSMFASGAGQSVEKLSAALAKVGITTREVRFREPGLDSLFLKLSGDTEVQK